MARTTAARTAAKGAKPAAKPAVKSTVKPAAKPATKAVKPAVKSAAKAAPKPVPKPVPKSTPKPAPMKAVRAKAATPAMLAKGAARSLSVAAKGKKAAPARPETGLRPVLVRDSFTMPEDEYAVLGAVKQACLQAGFDVKKSELLRIGVALLGQLDTAGLRAVLDGLPQLKTGRPPAE